MDSFTKFTKAYYSFISSDYSSPEYQAEQKQFKDLSLKVQMLNFIAKDTSSAEQRHLLNKRISELQSHIDKITKRWDDDRQQKIAKFVAYRWNMFMGNESYEEFNNRNDVMFAQYEHFKNIKDIPENQTFYEFMDNWRKEHEK